MAAAGRPLLEDDLGVGLGVVGRPAVDLGQVGQRRGVATPFRRQAEVLDLVAGRTERDEADQALHQAGRRRTPTPRDRPGGAAPARRRSRSGSPPRWPPPAAAAPTPPGPRGGARSTTSRSTAPAPPWSRVTGRSCPRARPPANQRRRERRSGDVPGPGARAGAGPRGARLRGVASPGRWACKGSGRRLTVRCADRRRNLRPAYSGRWSLLLLAVIPRRTSFTSVLPRR